MYAQLIDDVSGVTLVSADWREVDKKHFPKDTVDRAQAVGEILAKKAKESKISQAVFDRGGYKYHGKVRALAEGARSQGLQF
jgi:large subunit ribosomal protein L18